MYRARLIKEYRERGLFDSWTVKLLDSDYWYTYSGLPSLERIIERCELTVHRE